MLDFDQVERLIADIQCPPYEFRFSCIQCVRLGHQDLLAGCNNPNHTWFIQATLFRKDTDTGEWGTGHGGKYIISPHMTAGEIVKKCFVACRDYSEHEVREAFLFRGRRVLGPHIDISALWEVADKEEVRSG